MGQQAKTVEKFPTQTREQGKVENIRTADNSQFTKNMQPNLEVLKLQAQEDLEALRTKKVSDKGLSPDEERRLRIADESVKRVETLGATLLYGTGKGGISKSKDGSEILFYSGEAREVKFFDGVNRIVIKTTETVKTYNPNGTLISTDRSISTRGLTTHQAGGR